MPTLYIDVFIVLYAITFKREATSVSVCQIASQILQKNILIVRINPPPESIQKSEPGGQASGVLPSHSA